MKIADEMLLKTIRDFLTVYLPKQRCLSENTIKSYKFTLNLFTDYLEAEKSTPFSKLTCEHFNYQTVTDFLDWVQAARKCGTSTRNQRFMALKSFAKYAGKADISQGFVQMEMEKVPLQKSEQKIVRFLTESALQTLLAQPDLKRKSDKRNRFFMILMYDTAARCQELLDLRLKDFELAAKEPYVYLHGKGDKVRTVPLMPKTVQHYIAYLNEFHPPESRNNKDRLFYTTLHGNRCKMSADNAEYFIKRYGEQARLACSSVPERVFPHMLRHSRAIHLYRGGMPLALLSEYLGHANISTTQVYAYADTEMKRRAIEKIYPPEQGENAEAPMWEGDEKMLRKLYGLA